MEPEELRRWAIEQAAKISAVDIIEEAQRIMDFVRPSPLSAPSIETKRKQSAWLTPERAAFIRENFPLMPKFANLLYEVNKLPGVPVTAGNIRGFANRAKLKRPATEAYAAQAALMRAAREAKRANGHARA